MNPTRFKSALLLPALAAFLCILAAGCADRPPGREFTAPVPGAISVSATARKAFCQCTVSGAAASVEEQCFHIEGGGKAFNVEAAGSGTISARIEGLEPDTEYSVYALLSNGLVEVRSEAKEFTTASAKEFIEIEDKAFENYLLENFDRNGDGEISVVEARQITEIDVCTDCIRSLKGIEYMPYLKELKANGAETVGQGIAGALSELDVSSLQYLEVLRCRDNLLTELDVSCNPKLTIVDCSNTLVSELDLSNNQKLRELIIEYTPISALGNYSLPELEYLNVQSGRLETIDFSLYPKLRDLSLNDCPMEALPDPCYPERIESLHICATGGALFIPDGTWFSKFPNLTAVNYSCYDGETMDFSSNPKLRSLWGACCSNLRILDLSSSPDIYELYITECPNLTLYLHPDATPEIIEADEGLKIVRGKPGEE